MCVCGGGGGGHVLLVGLTIVKSEMVTYSFQEGYSEWW